MAHVARDFSEVPTGSSAKISQSLTVLSYRAPKQDADTGEQIFPLLVENDTRDRWKLWKEATQGVADRTQSTS